MGFEKAEGYLQMAASAHETFAARDWDEAATLWTALAAASPLHGDNWAYLAHCLQELGRYPEAIDAYLRVLDLGASTNVPFLPYPATTAYRIARCFALVGTQEEALAWLEKSFHLGFRYLDRLLEDTAFEALRDHPRFGVLTGTTATSRLSRDDGWRRDLDFLEREVHRKGHPISQFRKGQEFDRAADALRRSIPELTDLQVVVELMKLMAILGDGHSAIEGPPELLGALPLQFYLFEEGLFVIATQPKYESMLGAQVLAFDGTPIEEIVAGLTPVIARDNDFWPNEVAPHYMRNLALLQTLGLVRAGTGTDLHVVDRHGTGTSIGVDADAAYPTIWGMYPCPEGWLFFPDTLTSALPLYLKRMAESYWFEILPERRTVYVQFNRVLDDPTEPLAAFADRLFTEIARTHIDTLVLDVRWNNGGNTFLAMPLVRHLLACSQVNRPGGLFVIIGRRTFSAAQNFVTLIDRHAEVIFVGEPTGGRPNSIGDETYFQLPYSKLWANVADVFWQTSWPMDSRIWIAPHIYAPPAFAAYRENRDPALEAILG